MKTWYTYIINRLKELFTRRNKAMEYTITKDNFEEKVLNNKKTVLIDFWASWCGPCKMLSPIVSEIAEENSDIDVGKINVDEEAELSLEFSIMSIPTLIVFKDGKAVKKSIGLVSKQEILELIK